MLPIRFFVLFIVSFLPVYAGAVEVVRLEMQIGSSAHNVDIELFDSLTPITVQNFLNYVDVTSTNPRYDGSFVHRSAPGFVIQGGGFTYDPAFGAFTYDSANDLYPGGLQLVPKDDPIINEFQGSGLSNVRGTIAMALMPDDPNSATSDWFINMADNSSNLDSQNGGFAVFGKVIDDGMDVFDMIETIPIYNRSVDHFAMDSIPLDNYIDGSPVALENLVRVNTARSIQRPILKTDIVSLDFGLLPVGDSASLTVLIENTGNADLVMDSNSIAAMASPYSIIFEDCSNATLRPNEFDTCSITVQFSPVNTGAYNTQIAIIPADNPHNVTLNIDVLGEGVPVTPVLYIEGQPLTLDFSSVPVNTPESLDVVVQNRGGGALSISSISLSGQDAGLFSTDTGCDNSTILSISEVCTLKVTFTPDSEGLKTASLNINTNAGSGDISLNGDGQGPEIEVELSHDSGYTQLNVPKLTAIPIKNRGLAELEILAITISGPDAADFSQDNSCPNVATLDVQPLSPLFGQCTIVLTFTPATDGVKNAILTVTSTDSDEPSIDISLTGAVGEPDIDAISELDLGVSDINGAPTFKEFNIVNRGAAPLEFTTFALSGDNSSDFTIANDCPGISPDNTILPLELDEVCTIVVQLQSSVLGALNAQLMLETNDPDEPVVTISLTGVGDTDIDGIAFDIEQAAPNSGDGNNDTVQDDVQSNVASFVTAKNQFATIVTPPGTSLFEVSLPENPDKVNSPQGVGFDHGLFHYNILAQSTVPGAVVQVGLIMPQGDSATKYYKFGPTPEDNTAHWYEFTFDGTTGAQYLGNVDIDLPGGGGQKITRSMFLVYFVDGERGDDDLLVNGVITNTGAVGSSTTNTASGSGSVSWFMIIFAVCFYCRSLWPCSFHR